MPRKIQWWAIPVAAIAAFWMLAAAPSHGLGLRARQVAAGQVRIEWDRTRAVRAAKEAVLDIRDGVSRTVVPLSADRLLYGSVTYLRESGNLTVQMRLSPTNGAPPAEEIIAVLGSPVRRPQPAEPDSPLEPPAPTPVDLVPPVEIQPAVSRPPATVEAADRVAAPLRQLELPPRPPVTNIKEPVLPTPPALTANLGGVPAPPILNLTIPKPSISAPTGTPQPPRSGRMIWTGQLSRRGVVEIEGGRATVGALEGELPGAKVTLRISPAEFAEGGLVVYTGDRALANRTEQPSKGNGWNATRFAWDPERAHQIVVLEAPNSSNDFKRLALRSDARACSVILVDWSTQ